MRVRKRCETCGRPFLAIKDAQRWCQRRCFKRAYYIRVKSRNAELAKRLPGFACPLCHSLSQIPFDPLKNGTAFDSFICPYCGIPNKVMLAHNLDITFTLGNPGTVQYVISSAIISRI